MKFVELAALAALSLSLAACSSFTDTAELQSSPVLSVPAAPAVTVKTPRKKPVLAMSRDIEGGRLQCVPYVRDHSIIDIRGDAYTWWDKAAGRYVRTAAPRENAVVVLGGYGARRGHVALVRQIVDAREIRIDHANWMNDGAIYVNNPVKDVSAANDWSQVKVWNIQTGSWGVKTYEVRGFILPEPVVTNRVATIEDLIN